ncbi:MAG: molybdopterin cofactor-binding domain-containing protein [Thermoanaerobaculia bacterium]
MPESRERSVLEFYLNGHRIELQDPPPDLLLLDFLRSPEVALTGAKKGCGEGGCGACTVILSSFDRETGSVQHRAINSCLRPVCSLQGMVVTTIEGTGAVVPTTDQPVTLVQSASRASVMLTRRTPRDPEERRDLLSRLTASQQEKRVDNPEKSLLRRQTPAQLRPVQLRDSLPEARLLGLGAPLEESTPALEGTNPVSYRLAVNNGSQCGYCSSGFVMTMSALLLSNPKPTKKQIEDTFDGNICRCTGYRPILTAMETFAVDWSPEDEARRMKCKVDPAYDTQKVGELQIHYPAGARRPADPLQVDGPRKRWRSVASIDELRELIAKNPGEVIRLVHGNTSYGVYPDELRAATLLIDIRRIHELDRIEIDDQFLIVGAGTTYSHLIEILADLNGGGARAETTRLGALELMARRTAGTLVRNAGTLGGNSAMVLQHVHEGEAFPSDLLTALDAVEATLDTVDLDSGASRSWTVEELVAAVAGRSVDPRRLLIVAYRIPRGSGDEVVLAQKVALREVNAHSIVNATTRLGFGEGTEVAAATLVFGGIAPFPFRAEKTERLLVGATLSLDGFPALARELASEVAAELARWPHRGPYEGFTDEYKISLTVSFLYKAIVNALLVRAPGEVPPELRSAGVITWGRWPVSTGEQYYKTQGYKAPVQEPYIGLMTLYQTSGEVHYTHEIQVPPQALNGALVQGRQAPRKFWLALPDAPGEPATREALCAHLRERFEGFVDLLTASAIPKGGVNLQGMGGDQPLLATDELLYPGQVVAMVLASTEQMAWRIADYVGAECLGYGPIGWPAPFDESILSLERAIEIGSVYPDCPTTASWYAHVWRVTRPGSVLDWVDAKRGDLDREIVVREADVGGLPCAVVATSQEVGGQLHFYMETQACVATPQDANVILVNPSSQSPMEMHQTSASAIGVAQNRIRVQLKQLGGGYGGKTEPARFVAGPTVVAANATNRPVRLVLERARDSAMIGRRHPYFGQCQIALDRGEGRPEDKGLIRGLDVKMWGDGGAFYDCSFIVSNNILMRADNAYMVPSSRMQIDVCRTNKAPNTAFRSFGDIQSKLITENAIDDAAFVLGMRPEEVRKKNLYRRGDATPFGQALSYCYMREVWDYLETVCKLEEKQAEVDRFNKENRWRKRGLAMIPVKYGSGYNLVMLEQASAILSVFYADGTVIINQAGADMGQGSLTQVVQVAAYILNIPMSMIRIELPNTGIIPNPTSTGASTGTAYNAEATKGACRMLRQRLLDFGYQMLQQKGDDWCRDQGIDFWNYGQGWSQEVVVGSNPPKLIWRYLINLAYQQRVNLVAQFLAPMRGGETPAAAIEFKPVADQPAIPGATIDPSVKKVSTEIDEFSGFTYSAACSVVEVDILTGESKILECDLMYDMGWSINPALDIGQVEGAFIQGAGYVLSEWLVFEPEGDEKGRLNTDNTWRYKPPAVPTVPLRFDTHLFPRDLAANVPENPNEVMSAKEVGEPPLVLASTVFFAVKAAVRASRLERGLNGLFTLEAPATVQVVQKACALDAGGL